MRTYFVEIIDGPRSLKQYLMIITENIHTLSQLVNSNFPERTTTEYKIMKVYRADSNTKPAIICQCRCSSSGVITFTFACPQASAETIEMFGIVREFTEIIGQHLVATEQIEA